MIDQQQSNPQKQRVISCALCSSTQDILHLIIILTVALMLVACDSLPSTITEVTVQAALPTSTLEPTFTPSPPPTSTPSPSPTATTNAPTPTATPQASLSGHILEQETGQPIAEAQVSVGNATATTDADGRYTLTGLPPGQYIVSVTHPVYDPGLSSIFTLAVGEERSQDLSLYASDSPYPEDPMLTNPLDPNGAPTAEDAERLAREQGLTGQVVNIKETKLSGEFLVNYKIGDEVRAAVAEVRHEAWELTDETGQKWRIIKVCGNLASRLPKAVLIPTPKPISLPPLAEVIVDELKVRSCASEVCAEVGTVQRGTRVEVFGCLAGGGWCEVGWPDGRGWCTGSSLQQLAVAEAVPVVEVILPTPTPGVVATGAGKIVFVRSRDYGAGDDIYVMNADGSDLTRLTNDSAQEWDPAWSPDGQRIAFASTRGGKSFNIYVMNADGSGLTRLTDDPTANDWEPAWSPDGRQIAFTSDRDGTSPFQADIYVVNADGIGLTRLTNLPSLDASGPTWSPNGKHIAFTRGGDIYIMNTDGSGLTHLTTQIPTEFPAWSPDGRQVAFTSFRDGNPDIYVMNADGSDPTRLTNHPEGDMCPAWSPDSQQLVFTSTRDGSTAIYIINADGSSLTRLIDGKDSDWSR